MHEPKENCRVLLRFSLRDCLCVELTYQGYLYLFSKRNLRRVLRASDALLKAKGSLFSLSLTRASEKNRLIRPVLEGRLEGVYRVSQSL